jgi:hypothetical protein
MTAGVLTSAMPGNSNPKKAVTIRLTFNIEEELDKVENMLCRRKCGTLSVKQ